LTALRRAALFAAALVAMAVLFAPLRFALDRIDASRLGLAAAEVEGVVWSGRMRSASFHGLQLGDVHVGLRPLPLLLGRSRLVVETGENGPAPGRAVLVGEGRRSGVTDATLSLPLVFSQAAAPLRGEMRLQDVTVLFDGTACDKAGGRVVTDVLARNAEFLQWQGPELAGEVGCRGDSVVLPLRGARDGTDVSATVSVGSDGRYRLQTRVVTRDPALASALTLAGFRGGPEGLNRVDSGRLR
jgi:general secretion pathway protein N